MTVATLMTADELLRLPEDGWRYELVQGELKKMSPSGFQHGRIAARIIASLGSHAERHHLGAVCSSKVGFRLTRKPDTVRAPDVAFVRAERVTDTVAFFDGPPDVAFEVVSPNDRYTEVAEKTRQWLRAGATVVVIVDPGPRTVVMHRASGAVPIPDAIAIEDIIPGWQLPLSEVFD